MRFFFYHKWLCYFFLWLSRISQVTRHHRYVLFLSFFVFVSPCDGRKELSHRVILGPYKRADFSFLRPPWKTEGFWSLLRLSLLCFPLSYDSNRIDLNKVANHDVKLYAGRFTNRFLGIREAAQPSTRTIPLDGTRGYIRGIISCLVGFVGGKQSARPLQANVLPRNTSNTHSPLQYRFFRFRNTFPMRCIAHTVSFVSRICPFLDILDVSFFSPSYFPSVFTFAFGHLTIVFKKLLLTVTSRECFRCDRNESFLLLLLNDISMVTRENGRDTRTI